MDGIVPIHTTVRACSVEEIMGDPSFPMLSDEYEAESKIKGLPSPTRKMEQYQEMAWTGMLHPFGAWHGDQLVGFISLLTPTLPRYGALVAVVESFFVAKAHRKGGAGLRLLREVERVAAECQSPGIFVSSPIAAVLVEILPRRGYSASHLVFFKQVP